MTIVYFLLVLGFLVFIHEFGHFIVAKWCGVRVERFSIGFGPAIFKKTYGDTEYQVACIPLGGYVKMSGEDPSEELEDHKEEKEEEKEKLPPIPDEQKFHTQAVSKRLAIVFAGPLMNLICAFLLVPIVYMMGIEVNAALYEKPLIGFVDPDGPAHKADLRRGDLILSINCKEVSNWKKARTQILFHPDKELTFEISRNGEKIPKKIKTNTDPSLGGGTIGIFEDWPSKIERIIPGKPAEAAGFKDGDLFVKLGPIENPHWFQTQQYIQNHPNEAIPIVVERNGKTIALSVTPEVPKDIEGMENRGFIGIEPHQPFETRQFGFIESFGLGVKENVDNILTTFVVVGKLVTGGLNMKAIGGPVQIAEVTGSAARAGFSQLLLFTAFISLQLAILNLLPIPVLDGGHIAFMTIEALKGSPLSIKKRLIAQQVGFALLITFMVVVTINDIARHKASIFGFFKGLF